MRRHDFEPGRLIVGLVMLGGGLAYLLNAAGRWPFPAYALVPALVGGLCLGGAVPGIAYLVGRRRGRRGIGR
ncbi:hypothetical protein [Streptomyces luteireticuli]|uniref:hypothetical protein n=1 Tax=Streptomyces luteireticuli TaxID=173858 RepID=UPI003555FE52